MLLSICHTQSGRGHVGRAPSSTGRSARLRNTGELRGFLPVLLGHCSTGLLEFTTGLCCPCLVPRWRPGCQETRQGSGWSPKVPPPKRKGNSPKHTPRRRRRGSQGGRRWNEHTRPVTVEKADRRSVCRREGPHRIQWVFAFRLNSAPV